jgi:hypothetical protein
LFGQYIVVNWRVGLVVSLMVIGGCFEHVSGAYKSLVDNIIVDELWLF